MKIVRIYTGADGESHFQDLTLSFTEREGTRTKEQAAKGVQFRLVTSGYSRDFHTPAQRQYVCYLRGGVEIEVGDGTKRQMRAGDVLLAEDTTGRGHISRALDGKPCFSAFVPLA